MDSSPCVAPEQNPEKATNAKINCIKNEYQYTKKLYTKIQKKRGSNFHCGLHLMPSTTTGTNSTPICYTISFIIYRIVVSSNHYRILCFSYKFFIIWNEIKQLLFGMLSSPSVCFGSSWVDVFLTSWLSQLYPYWPIYHRSLISLPWIDLFTYVWYRTP